jgi:thioredoxin 1
MSYVVDATDLTWEEVVERSKMPVLAIFHSPACPYCQEMMPYFEEYAGEFQGRAKFVRINILESSFIPERYGVMATPTFKLFCGGRPVLEMVGAVQPSHLKRMVEEGISTGAECRRRSTPIDYNIGYV